MPVSKIPGAGISGGSVTVSQTAPDNSLVIDSSGNVGIGTSSPTPTNGKALVIYETTYPRLTLRNSTTGTASTDGYGLVGVGSDLYVENAENGNMVFTTNNTERMRINSAGAVTTPFQPSFVASRSGDYTITDATVAVWNSTSRNVGTHYNTSNGLFTAPVAGMYLFTVSIFASISMSQIWWVINGARGVSVTLSGAGQSILVGSATVYLNANDTIGFAPYSGTATYTFYANALHSYFAGTLLG